MCVRNGIGMGEFTYKIGDRVEDSVEVTLGFSVVGDTERICRGVSSSYWFLFNNNNAHHIHIYKTMVEVRSEEQYSTITY